MRDAIIIATLIYVVRIFARIAVALETIAKRSDQNSVCKFTEQTIPFRMRT